MTTDYLDEREPSPFMELNWKIRKARKEHACSNCRKPIHIGERHIVRSILDLDDKKVFNFREHLNDPEGWCYT